MDRPRKATGFKKFDIILSKKVSAEDTSWKFNVAIPHIPEKYVDESGNEKIWIKALSITKNLEIRLSIDEHSTNRILSSEAKEKFLLASFASFRFEDAPPKLTTDYIERLLHTGVQINGIKYIFYGHSNSQLKNKTCYLFAPTNKLNGSQEIMNRINSLGDFSKINSVSKRAKRIGLLFTQSKSSIQLKAKDTTEIDDIEENGYLFTDGCGMLSKSFVIELAKKNKIIFHNTNYFPSAFQIRYKGYKGMLMLNPTLKEKASFRDSMKKFKGCEDNTFSVLDYSKPFTFAYLNGELVTLLSTLGIPDQVFVEKQKEYFEFLRQASVNPYTAFQFLCYKCEMDLAESVLLQGLTDQLKAKVKKMVKEEWAGAFKKKEVKADNERVRILIKESRILFGVCDYTGILQEGQCHVRITAETGGPKSLDGAEVIVSRNPCLHPGDIRKFRAVEAIELNHLVDCIVFPTVGKRDAASLMSGGDLDGDKFFVSWDPDIIPSTLFEAYGYPPAREAPGRGIKYEDMINYFARYTNASLGRVKNLYLDWVRLSPEGAGSTQCQELNKLFSSCVDGEIIKIHEHLENPPKPPEGSKAFILDMLSENVKTIGKSFFEANLEKFETNSEELLHQLLTSNELCLIDEFELFQLTLRWSRNNLHDIQEFLPYFDFGAFTLIQKHAVLISLTEEDRSLREMYIGPIYNSLYQSRLLTHNELSSSNLNSPDVRWQLLYDSNDDDGARLYNSMEKAMGDFDKKIVVFNVDEQLKVVVYVPKKVEKGVDLDVGGEQGPSSRGRGQGGNSTRGQRGRGQNPIQQNEPRSVGLTTLQKLKYFPTVKLFAFDPLSGHSYKQTTVSGYKLSYDGEIIQLYEKRRANTFVWLGLNEKWSERNGIRRKGEEENPEFKVSIALQKFSDRLSQSHHRVTKQGSRGIEIYVISNRDRVGHNILDISMNQIETSEVKKILQNIPKEYEIPIHEEDQADFQFREFCIPILVNNKLEELASLLSSCEMEQILYACLNDERKLFQIFEAILQHRKLTEFLNSSNMLLKLLEESPSLSMLVIPALENGTITLPPYDTMNFLLSLIKSLLITCNDIKDSAFILFQRLLAWIYKSKIDVLTITELVDIVKRIIMTIRHSNLAEEFVLELFKEENGLFQEDSADFKYAKHFLLALAMNYLGEIKEACPCDIRGIPFGAEEYGTMVTESGNKNTHTLAEFVTGKFAKLGLVDSSENAGESSMKKSTKKLEPEQICLEITYSPRSIGLYETILRTDIICRIRNEDHVRFCASKRSSNNPKKKIAVFDAVVQSIQRGKLEFRILQTEPLELTKASWNLYICGSTTNFNTQLLAIKTLLRKGEESTVAYRDIVQLTADSRSISGEEEKQRPKLELQLPPGKFNESQERAVREALSYPLTLIWGPPGTGKTTVVVEIIMQFMRLRPSLRLLISASTHNAVDNVMERFIKARKAQGDSKSEDAIRFTSEVSKVTPELKAWTLDAFVGKDLHLDDKAKGTALKKLKEAQIVFSTCSGSGVGMLRGVDYQNSSVLSLKGASNDDEDETTARKKMKKKLKSEQKFDIVIVDEASQITEPDALIPIVKSSKFVILVGDHVQLCPTVNQIAKDYGLEKSLFEKLYTSSTSSGSLRKVMLDTQYRMHPDLVKFPSKSFYEGKLKTGIKREERVLPPSEFPWPSIPSQINDAFRCVFLNCPEKESSYGDSSKFNIGQVKMTLKVIKLLRTTATDNKSDFKPKIVVLTPYAKQKEKTLQAIKGTSWASGVEVNTIDGFQGREADIIIFATVRANLHKNLGFSDDPRRVNVALTRAKYGIVIIGHEETLAAGEITKGMVTSCVKIADCDELNKI